eukprot:452636-Pelagomonas_calceolata.AAC.5
MGSRLMLIPCLLLQEDDDNSFALVVTVHAAKGSPLARMLGLEEEQTSDGAHKRQQVTCAVQCSMSSLIFPRA